MPILKYTSVMLLLRLAVAVRITVLATLPTLASPSLASTLIAAHSPPIFTLSLDPATNATTLSSYQIVQGQVLLNSSYPLEDKPNQRWQLLEVNGEIVAFPLVMMGSLVVLDQKDLSPQKTIINKWNFLNIISAQKYNVIFLSTNSGNIYYTQKTNPYSHFQLLLGSKHVGNVYLSLSPDNLYLCSTDQFTGYITIWSVPTLNKLYQFNTQENGIRAHTWDITSKMVYAFGYKSGQVYAFSVDQCLQLAKQVPSDLTYVTSCFYSYQKNEIVAFSFNLSAVVSFSTVDYTYEVVLAYQGAEKIQFDQTLKYFSVFNNSTASYYAIESQCTSNQYVDSSTYQCRNCGAFCLSCSSDSCYSCSQGYTLSSDGFNCSKSASSGSNNSTAPGSSKSGSYQPSIWDSASAAVMNATLKLINATYKVPGQRQFLNIFFQLFSSFDHLMPYIYHNRTYGPNMLFFLHLIHNTIDYRFSIINNQFCQKYTGIDFNQWKRNIDFKYNYSYQTIVSIQNNGQGIFVNNLQYFFLNIPLTLLTVSLAKWAFHLLFNFSFSLFLRKFHFFGIIMISLLQGNVELFFFSFAGDFLNLFSPNFTLKLVNVATIFAGWLCLCLSTVGLFSIYWMYKKNAKFLFQNCKGSHQSSIYYLTTNGLMNIARGMIHRILITMPSEQLLALMALELAEIGIHVYYLKKLKIFESSFILSLLVASNVTRVALDFSLLFQSETTISFLDQVHCLIIFITIVLIFLGVFNSVNELLRETKKLFLLQVEKCRIQNRVKVVQKTNLRLHITKQNISKPKKPRKYNWSLAQGKVKIKKNVQFQQSQITRQSTKNTITSQKLKKQDFTNRKVKKVRRVVAQSKHLNIIFTKKQVGPHSVKK